MTTQAWVVALESAQPEGGPPTTPEALQLLVAALPAGTTSATVAPDRYTLRLTVDAGTPAEALFVATSRWQDAIRQLGLPPWPLTRAEVLTPEEHHRDHSRSGHGGGSAVTSDDLLLRVFTDSLTGLASWEVLLDRARAALAQPEAGTSLAVILVDVDDFAAVNRRHGYASGDRVLAALARRIDGAAAGALGVSRVGGNAFGVLVRVPPEGAGEAGDRLLQRVREAFEVDGSRLALTASAGVAVSPPTTHADELVAEAETALAAAKAAGGDRCRTFEPGGGLEYGRFGARGHPTPDRIAHLVLLQRAALAANESPTLESAAAVVLQQVCTLVGWTAGHLWVTDPARGNLVATGVWNAGRPERLRPLVEAVEGLVATGDTLPGKVLESGRAVWTADPAVDGGPQGVVAAGTGMRSGLALPVLVRDEVVAVLQFWSDSPAPVDDGLADVMATVCSQLGRVAERRRAQEALAHSEELYRTLADSAPVLIWTSDRSGGRASFNSTWLDYTGRTIEDERGGGWQAGVHPDDLDRCVATARRAQEARQPFEMEYRLRGAGGGYRWFLDRGRPVGAGQAFVGFVGACGDVTDTRRGDELLRDRETHVRVLMQNADVMLVVLDAAGIIRAEYAGTFHLGHPAGFRIGVPALLYVHPGDRRRVAAEFVGALASPGIGRNVSCRVRQGDGSWTWVQAVANSLLDDPLVAGVLITLADPMGGAEGLALRESISHLHHAQALHAMGSWYQDLMTGQSFWSDELYRIMGRSKAEGPPDMEGFLALVCAEDRPVMVAAAASLIEGEGQTVEFRVVRADGRVSWIHSSATLVRDGDGVAVRAVGTMEELGVDGVLPAGNRHI